MSIANSTLHFHFPLVAGTDRPLFEDYNATMELLDEKLYEAISTLDVIPQEITDLQDAALSLGGRVTDLETFETNQTGTNELVSNAILALQGAVAAIPTKFSSVGIADAYDAEHGVYNVGDVVTYDGQRYECITAVTAAEPFDVSKWNAKDVQAVFDEINTALSADETALNNIGTVYTFTTLETSNLSADTDTLICKTNNIPFGTYLVVANVNLDTNSDGVATVMRSDGGGLRSQGFAQSVFKPSIILSDVVTISEATHSIYLKVNSHSANTVLNVALSAIRIK